MVVWNSLLRMIKPSLLKKSEVRLQVIEFIKLHQPTTAKAIAQFLGIRAAGLTSTLQALFRHGYLTRKKSDKLKTIKNTFYYWSLAPDAKWSVPFLFQEEQTKPRLVKGENKSARTMLSSITPDDLEWMQYWSSRRKLRKAKINLYSNLTPES